MCSTGNIKIKVVYTWLILQIVLNTSKQNENAPMFLSSRHVLGISFFPYTNLASLSFFFQIGGIFFAESEFIKGFLQYFWFSNSFKIFKWIVHKHFVKSFVYSQE